METQFAPSADPNQVINELLGQITIYVRELAILKSYSLGLVEQIEALQARVALLESEDAK
jgi:hypothetical protein